MAPTVVAEPPGDVRVPDLQTSALQRSAWPTRKWWAGLITAVAALAVNLIETGHFNKEIAIALVGLVAQALVVYIVPNDNTPGGVPLRSSP
jgi:hypothetical protein